MQVEMSSQQPPGAPVEISSEPPSQVDFSCISSSLRLFIEDNLVEEFSRPFASTFSLTQDHLSEFKQQIRTRVKLSLNAVFEANVGSAEEAASLPAALGDFGVSFENIVRRLARLKKISSVRSISKQNNYEKYKQKMINGDFDEDFGGLSSADVLSIIKDIIWGGSKVDNSLFRPHNLIFKDLSFSAVAGIHGDAQTVGSILKKLACCIPNAIKGICETKPPAVENQILHSISGVFKPSRITLVLGPPGAGKSTLFHALSGRLSGNLSGTTMFGHIDLSKVFVQNFVSVVEQIDIHHATLTTRETLEFGHNCRMYHVEKYTPMLAENVRKHFNYEAWRKQCAQQANMQMAMLGLLGCADTVIGDAVLKGVSGGEKRRVTLGEMLISHTRVLLLDEISTGLDSAATLDITKTLKAMSRIFNVTPVVSLLQPPPETFVQFDDLLLLDSGRIMYLGPREDVMDYFESLGYRCPEMKDPADFLQEVTTRNNAVYLMDGAVDPPKTAEEFAQAYERSKYAAENKKIIDAQIESESPAPATDIGTGLDVIANMGKYRQPKMVLFKLLFKRQLQLLFRNKVYINAHIISNLFLGVVFGLTYWQQPTAITSGLNMVVLIFNVIQNLSIASFQMIPTIMDQRQVYYKQKMENFFPPAAYIVADTLAFMPIAVLDTFTYGTIVYFMTGMAYQAAPYFTWIGILITFGLYAAVSTRALCFLIPDLDGAQGMLILIMVMFILTSGLLVNPVLLESSWLVWMYWANPFAYTLRGLFLDQMTSGDYAKPCPGSGNMTCGSVVLETQGFTTDQKWIGLNVVFNLGIMLFFGFIAAYSLTYVDHSGGGDGSAGDDGADDKSADSERSADSSPVNTPHSVPPHAISFQNLTYTIDLKQKDGTSSIDILKGIGGYAKPGEMTALMGSSGAGKTTLLDVLAGRKTTGRIIGDICINGRPKNRPF